MRHQEAVRHFPHMSIGDFRFWRSSVVCWTLFGVFAALTTMWQLVDVKPYPHMYRDWLIGTIAWGSATGVFLIFACYTKKWRSEK